MFDMTNSLCTVALTREAVFLGHQAALEKRGRAYQQPVRTMTPFSARSGWTERAGSELSRGPAVLRTTYSLKWQGRTLVPSIPAPSRGVSLLRETNEDFLITRLIRDIEDLHISAGASVPKKALSARSSIVHLAQQPTICCGLPESARVLRHHHNNQLRMLTHRWKRLGLQYPASRNRDDHTFERSQEKSQDEVKNDSPLKITAMQTSHTEAPRARKQGNEERMKGSLYSSSAISNVGIPEVKTDMDTQSKTAVSLELHSDDSDISDQEKGSVKVSKWAAPLELDLRPEPFDKDPDLPCSTETEVQVYAEVLPAPLKDLDFTQGLSSTEYSEGLQRLFTSDPCLAPMVARLLELERLQAATVQKERVKPVRSRPTTASTPTRNASRLRNGDPAESKLGISGDAECNSVTCSFTKLMLCPNSLCRGRHHTCPLTKSGQGSRSMGLHQTLPKRPQTMSGKFNRTESVVPSVRVSPTTSNRIKRLRAAKKSTKPRRADSPPTSAKKTVTALNRKA